MNGTCVFWPKLAFVVSLVEHVNINNRPLPSVLGWRSFPCFVLETFIFAATLLFHEHRVCFVV